VTKGVISLEGVSCDDLECSALEAARFRLEYPLDEGVEVIRMGGLGEWCVGWIRLTCFVVLIPFLEHARFRGDRWWVMDREAGSAFEEVCRPVPLPWP
jgi:hypothetical protein